MGTRPILPNPIGLFRWMLCLFAAALAAAPAAAQGGPQVVTMETRASIVTLGSLVKAQDLDFGDIIPGSTGGTVTVSVTGGRTSTGGVTLVGASHHPAIFVGQGRRNQMIELSFGSPTIQLTGPGSPMTVSLFVIGEVDGSLNRNRPGRYRITTRNGNFSFPVGATLSVNANQRAGLYTGTFDVIYEFQ
jgi:hypothetical protein